MAILEYTRLEQPQPVEATIWPVEINEPLREHMGTKSTEFYVTLGDRAIGMVQWEATEDNNYGYIDGVDPHEGVDAEALSLDEWDAIVVAMHSTIKVLEQRHISLIEFPGGSRAFLQPL